MIIVMGSVYKERLCGHIKGATCDADIVDGRAGKDIGIAGDAGVTDLDANALLRDDIVGNVSRTFGEVQRAAIAALPLHNRVVVDLNKVALEEIDIDTGGNSRAVVGCRLVI